MLLLLILLIGSALLYESNTNSISSAKQSLSSASSIVADGVILGVDGYPGTPQFANTLINQYDIKWLRVDIGSVQQQESYLLPDGYNIVANLNSCSTLGTLASATQCYQNEVSSNPKIHVWEIFNEPNDVSYQGGFQNGNPYNDYLLTKAAYQVIKAHNPKDIVLAPSISIATFITQNKVSPSTYAWMAQYWSYGAGKYLSYVSLHEYPDGLYSEVPPGSTENNSQIIGAGLDKYESLVQKSIWITETGCDLPNQAQLAACLTEDYDMLFARPYIQGIFWYELSDYSYSGQSQTTWGLFGTSNQPKVPVLKAFELFNAKAILDQISALSTNLITPSA